MEISGVPYKFSKIWGASAGGSYITSPIPATSTGGNAGQDIGFPPVTMQPPAAGGIPPEGPDFNGVNYYFSAWANWFQAGGPITYDATFSGDFGGYPQGAALAQNAEPLQRWVSTVDNNTSDPDTGGADWVDPFVADLAAPGFQFVSARLMLQWATVSVSLTAGVTSPVELIAPPFSFPNAILAVLASSGAYGTTSPGVFEVGANVSGPFVEYVVTNLGAVDGTADVTFLFIGH